MFVLWRYIIKEHIGPFVFAICVITLVFILNLVFRELPRILSRGLEFSLILEFFMLNMAWIVALAVPMAVLVAALMAFGRLSGDNEIVAMKANGVSVLRMIFPVLLCAAGLALFLVWFNNSVLPDFNHRARLLASDIARKRPTLSLEAGVLYRDLPNYTLLVQNIVETPDTAYVDSVYIDDNSNPNSSTFITADRGKIYLNRRNGQLSLILFDGVMYKLNLEEMEQYQQLRFPKQVISISVPDMVMERSDSEYRGDREKSAAMMREEVGQNRKEIAAAVARMQAKTE
ncbi:MAG TPA: LptF/LptG family permease, partial [bacterium]|nr:LptF/LptG family permease [bacterium]